MGAKLRIGTYNILVKQYCTRYIHDAELNTSIRIVCKELHKEIGLNYTAALQRTDIVIEVLDKLIKSGKIRPRAAEIFKNDAEYVIVCCKNVYENLFKEKLKTFGSSKHIHHD